MSGTDGTYRIPDLDRGRYSVTIELRRRGVTIVTEPFTLDVINRKLAFFSDPWGNLVELAQVLREQGDQIETVVDES